MSVLGRVVYIGPPTPANGSTTSLFSGQGVYAHANGGEGGPGGSGFLAGSSAQGGRVLLNLSGPGLPSSTGGQSPQPVYAIDASGYYAHGALLQAIGGAGESAGSSQNLFLGLGAPGADGGNGGRIEVRSNNANVITRGANSFGIIAQSIGGNGGNGGDVTVAGGIATVAIGGAGRRGGNADLVNLDLTGGLIASTSTIGGGGILAQSLGGGGGAGGTAVSTTVGTFSLSVGGKAGAGGTGSDVTINNGALISTQGDHAAGIHAQSIGGSGGKGGSGISLSASLVSVSVGVGGEGGDGQSAGNVSVTNTSSGQITTYGPDAYGIHAQSIGGGGGVGGAALARALALGPGGDIPSIALSFPVGGKGGSGSLGGLVKLDNAGLITTIGDGATGIMAQSIGGGGGAGGDASATAAASTFGENGVAITLGVTIGGKGAGGGKSDAVSVTNSGLIATLGQDAYGVFAQSVGGGGGAGGAGDAATTSAAGDKKSLGLAATLAIGGNGGTGNDAGTVTMLNTGAVTTRGDGSDGVFAQSVGGGGGVAGGGTANASSSNLSLSIGVGGQGGAGGDGSQATATNSGSIITRGTDAVGLYVQSIGGGGGKGGKGGATAGGTNTAGTAQVFIDALSQGLGLGQGVQTFADGLLKIGAEGEKVAANAEQLENILTQPQAELTKILTAPKVNVSVAVGGSGGAAGDGKAASAVNSGYIGTFGAQSDGILVQSVGGGGGSGGAASSTGLSATPAGPKQISVGVGGNGGGGGSGGAVTVVNALGGSILTQGVAAFGLVAQSIGGGGGEGGTAAAKDGSLLSLQVVVGGNNGGGKSSDGGSVLVASESGASIATTGKHGIGILAQSIGGGGGLVRTMTTDQTSDPKLKDPVTTNPDTHLVPVSLGGLNGSIGNGGTVTVTTAGAVTTAGLDAHGILAQSIGAGGGAIIGGQALLASNGGGSSASGLGGAVSVQLQPGTQITTTGAGSYGVLAQSIGGGGGIAGDLSAVSGYTTSLRGFTVGGGAGSGGVVTVTADNALIQTTGAFAPAIFAQSIGGGGGLVNAQSGNQYSGTAGGIGLGFPVSVTLTNSRVLGMGEGSAGIVAQSTGGLGAFPITIDIDAASLVQQGGGPTSSNSPIDPGTNAAIVLLGGENNRINNAGTIVGNRTGGGGLAILTNTPRSNLYLSNTGTITGDQQFSDGGGSIVDNRLGGVINAPSMLLLGRSGLLANAGTLYVGGIGTIGRTVLTGDLTQTETGTVRIDVDARTGRSDLLQVTGRAALDGTVVVNPISFRKGVTEPVITAEGGLAGRPAVQGLATAVFSQTPVFTGNTLAISTDADFKAGDPTKSATERSLAANLQRTFDTTAPGFDQGFARLAGLATDGAYRQALRELSGQEIAAVASARFEASQTFARDAFGCATSPADLGSRPSTDCVWGRVAGSLIDSGSGSGYPAFHWGSTSVKIGGQVAIAPNLFLTAVAGYERGQLNESNSAARAIGDTGLALVGLRYVVGSWTFDGVIDGAYGGVDLRRTAFSLGSSTVAKTNAYNAGLHLRAGYTIPMGAIYAEPALELDAVHVGIRGYTEQGGGPFNLRVAGLADTVFAATPGVRVGSRFGLGPDMAANVYAGAGLSFLAGNSFEARARFATLGPSDSGFRTAFVNDEVVGRFVAGVEVRSLGGLDFRLQYMGRQSSQQTEHGGQLRVDYRF